MTLIIGLRTKDKVYVAGDSGVIGWNESFRISQPKVYRLGEFLVGLTGSPRAGQLLQFNLEDFMRTSEMDGDGIEYICRVFIPRYKEILKAEDELDAFKGTSQFLVGHRKSLYVIYDDFSVLTVPTRFDAVGCGRDYALGALSILDTMDISPEEKIRRAFKATAKQVNILSPYRIMET